MKPGVIIGVVVVFGGVVLGAGAMGVVQIPGISPKKAQAKKADAKAEEADKEKPADPEVAETAEPITAASQEPEPAAIRKAPELPSELIEPERGAKRLARLWNEVETARLATVIASWKDEDLAPVLLKMDNAKVAELLAALEPERASSLSRLVRELSSKVAVVPEA